MRKILSFIIFTIAFTTKTSAAILLNEISPRSSPEWIELYNNGSEAVDITGWYLLDKQNNKKTITAPEPILPNTYYIFTGINSWLNNDEDEIVSLFDVDGIPIDSVAFPKTNESTTVSRQPDFTGSWLTNQLPTQGYSNTPPSPSPSSTSSPNPSLNPSYSPALAQVPSPSPSVLPSPTPTPTPSPTPKPSIKPSPSVLPSPEEVASVAGVTTEIDFSSFGVSPTPESSLPGDSRQAGRKAPELNKARAKNLIYIGIGLILISLAGFLGYRKYINSHIISE